MLDSKNIPYVVGICVRRRGVARPHRSVSTLCTGTDRRRVVQHMRYPASGGIDVDGFLDPAIRADTATEVVRTVARVGGLSEPTERPDGGRARDVIRPILELPAIMPAEGANPGS